ncbi:MucR family transcriptional regulator [Sulfitobacter sp. S0837]|uniref:MucR family transcriptional regulator n=1 Tax=Sulfitobacter maritimus TaxID=2741719 RepID=UPI001581BCCC|nr:MucR family transcriptional regulator [Sulfitobacter maritimus]NUH64940.1 MucR family transcriptional regulator [Sulfitobacter maritimus]
MPNVTHKQTLSDTAIATIVSGFASRSDVTIDDILTLVDRLRATAPAQTQSETVIPGLAVAPKARAIPAAAVEQTMTEDTIFCLCCGKGFKMLKRHIGAEHGLTEAEYRVMFNLPADAPLVAPSYSKRKAEYAKRAGLGKYTRDKSDRNAELS